MKGPVDDEVQEGRNHQHISLLIERVARLMLADLISTIEFNEDGELLAVGDKGGRIVVFQREQQVRDALAEVTGNWGRKEGTERDVSL